MLESQFLQVLYLFLFRGSLYAMQCALLDDQGTAHDVVP